MTDTSTLYSASPSREDVKGFLTQGLNPGQTWFFWCLKGATHNSFTQQPDGWEWPPRVSGRIAATSKKEARQKVCEDFGEDYPMRVLDKDRVKYPFLLYIEEMTPNNRYALRFMPRACEICGSQFTLHDHYMEPERSARGGDHTCSQACESVFRNHQSRDWIAMKNDTGQHPAVIYSILHKPTGQRYIGKTTQAFTLRWYQHFFQPGDTAFHQLIQASAITDWTFEVLEQIHLTISETIRRGTPEYHQAVLQREQHWIDTYDTINNGLNSVVSVKSTADAYPPLEGAV